MRKLVLYETDGFPATRLQLIVSCTKVIQDYETLDYFFVATTVQGGRVQSNIFDCKEKAEKERTLFIKALSLENRHANTETIKVMNSMLRKRK